MKMNNRADSRLLSPWFFIVLAIIGVSIVVGVLLFYSIETDIRFAEARSLFNRLIWAVSEEGYLKEEVLDENFGIMHEAGLERESFVRGGLFYFNLEIVELEDNLEELMLREFQEGEIDFEKQCRLSGDPLAKCVFDEFIVLNKSNPDQEFVIRILAGSNQMGKKI